MEVGGRRIRGELQFPMVRVDNQIKDQETGLKMEIEMNTGMGPGGSRGGYVFGTKS